MIKCETIDLLKIASEAKKLARLESAIKLLKYAYHESLNEWKQNNGIDYVDRNSDQWGEMMTYANKEWEAYNKARKNYRNTFRRLINATKKVKI